VKQTVSSRRDYLAIIEAAYASCASDEDWLAQIAEAAVPILDQGMGAHAFTYDARDPARVGITGFGQAGTPAQLEKGAREFIAALNADAARVLFPPDPPVALLHRVLAPVRPTPEMAMALRGGGVADAVGVRGHNPDGCGLVLSAAAGKEAVLPPRTTWAMTRVAVHLAAAARLRLHSPVSSRLDDADAIFSPRGKLQHLADSTSGTAAERALPDAVESRLAANGAREDPKRALELWRALFAGRWSVVDHVDRDGKRFILAKSNPPGAHTPAALTPSERLVMAYAGWNHSNKLIAYELGLAPSTVSVLLRSGLRKLHVRSRQELARILASATIPR